MKYKHLTCGLQILLSVLACPPPRRWAMAKARWTAVGTFNPGETVGGVKNTG